MCLEEKPREDSHHHVLIYDSDTMPIQMLSLDTPKIIPSPYTTIQTLDSKANMGNISKTFLIDISVKTGIMEKNQVGVDCTPKEIVSFTYPFKELHNVFSWSYKEIPDIDPSIFENKIKVYDNAKPVHQRLRPIWPCKTAMIKTKVENLLRVGFIYPIPLMELVSNMVAADKK